MYIITNISKYKKILEIHKYLDSRTPRWIFAWALATPHKCLIHRAIKYLKVLQPSAFVFIPQSYNADIKQLTMIVSIPVLYIGIWLFVAVMVISR